MSEPRPWRRLFGLSLVDFFRGLPVAVEMEKDLSLKQQLLDVILLRKEEGILPLRLPDGFEGLAREEALTPMRMGVYEVRHFTGPIRVVVVHELPREEHNALLHRAVLFSRVVGAMSAKPVNVRHGWRTLTPKQTLGSSPFAPAHRNVRQSATPRQQRGNECQ